MKFLTVLLAGLLATVTAHADTAGAQGTDSKAYAAAQDFIKTTGQDARIEQRLSSMLGMGFVPPVGDPNHDKAVQLASDTAKSIAAAHSKEILESKAVIYAQFFTADELKQMRDFYLTPTGQKWLKQMPDILRADSQGEFKFIAPLRTEATDQLRAAYKKNKIPLPPSMEGASK